MALPKRKKNDEVYVDSQSDCESINDISEDDLHVLRPQGEEENWASKYTPTASNNICIHPRKLKEVRDSLSLMFSSQSSHRLLILSGPAGSSKSTTVKVLAQEILSDLALGGGLDTYTETGIDKVSHGPADSWIEYLDEAGEVSQPSRFLEFLEDAKYRTGNNTCLVIVEDLPNIFHRKSLENFRRAILEWIYTNTTVKLPPLVLCITEIESLREHYGDTFSVESNLTVETLLGKEILNARDQIKRITFNPIAKTYLKKTLERIVASEYQTFQNISKTKITQFIDSIMASGDVRSAISNLQFWSTLALKDKEDEFDFLRESQLGLFHAVGKIVFSSSKFKGLGAEELDSMSVEQVLTSFGNTNLLLLALLENYQVVNGLEYSVKTAVNITDALSLNDCIPLTEGDEYSIRSVRNHLRKLQNQTTASRALNLQFPRQFKMVRAYNRVYKEIQEYRESVCCMRQSVQELNLLDGYFVPRIYNSFAYKRKHGTGKLDYNRLGGTFKKVYTDSTVLVDEFDTGETVRDQFRLDIMNHGAKIEDDSDQLSDPISDSESDDFLSDSDLEGLISQGVV